MQRALLLIIATLALSINCWLQLDRYEDKITVGEELALVATFPEQANDFQEYAPVLYAEERPEQRIQPVDSILIVHDLDGTIYSCHKLEKELVVHEGEFFVQIGSAFLLDDKFNTATQITVMLRYKNEIVSNKLVLNVIFKIMPEMLPTLTIFGAQQSSCNEYKFMRTEKIAFGVTPPWMERHEIEFYNVKLSVYGNDTKKSIDIYKKARIVYEEGKPTSALICEWPIGDHLLGNRVMTARLTFQAIAKNHHWKRSVFDQESSVRFVVTSAAEKSLASAKSPSKRTESKKTKQEIDNKNAEINFDEGMLQSLTVGNSGCFNPLTSALDDSASRIALLADTIKEAPKLRIIEPPANGIFHAGDRVVLDLIFGSNPKEFKIRNISLEVCDPKHASFPIDLFNELPGCWEWSREIHLIDWVIPDSFDGAGNIQLSVRYEAQVNEKEHALYQSVAPLRIGKK